MHENAKPASLARFRQLICETGDASLSLFVLELVRELHETTQKPLNDILTVADGPDYELCLQAVDWLEQERIVSITGDAIQLTALGRQSLTHAAKTDRGLSGFLAGNGPQPDTATANLMVLAILKAHFKNRRRCKP